MIYIFTLLLPSSPSVLQFLFFLGGVLYISTSLHHGYKRDVMKLRLLWMPSFLHVYLMHLSRVHSSEFSLQVIDCFQANLNDKSYCSGTVSEFIGVFRNSVFLFACIILHFSLIERQSYLLYAVYILHTCLGLFFLASCVCISAS